VPALQELLPPWLPPALAERILVGLVGVVAIWIAARLLRRSTSRWIGEPATQYRVRKVINIAAAGAAVLFIAFVVVDRLTGLGVTLGLVGAAVAFALQQPLLSLAGWLALAFGGYYRAGDRVEVGGVTGDVVDVSLLRTTLFEVGGASTAGGYTGRVVRVANSAVLTEPVYNHSGDFPFVWDAIDVPIRHGSDRAAAREALEAALRETVGEEAPEAGTTWRRLRRKYRLPEADVEPGVGLAADENWLTYRLRYVVDYRRRGAVKNALWRRVLDAVDAAEDVELAAASQEITVTPDSEVGVRTVDGDGDDDPGLGEGPTPGS
jgi:small-conductance mechanosensitive channel